MLHICNCAVTVLGGVNFITVLEFLAGGVDGAEVAEDGGVLLEGVDDGGLAAPPRHEVLECPHFPRLLHRIRELKEGEGVGGGRGRLVGLLAGEGGLDLVEPPEGGEMWGRGDAAGSREKMERPAGRHG